MRWKDSLVDQIVRSAKSIRRRTYVVLCSGPVALARADAC